MGAGGLRVRVRVADGDFDGRVLLIGAPRYRLPIWEYAVVAGLLVMTFQAARNGIWLAIWLVPATGRGPRSLGPGRGRSPGPGRSRLAAVAGGLALLAVVTMGVHQRSTVVWSDRQIARQIASGDRT